MKRIVTISREFGSGGRSVGKELAKRLAVEYYDKELVLKVAEKSGFAPDFVAEKSEYADGRSPLSYAFTQGMPGIMGGLSAPEYLWIVQRQVIEELAKKDPCVIVGRCADYILRERDDCLNVFIHAPVEFRAQRIVGLYGESDKVPEKRLREKDDKRRANYKHFCGGEWGKAQNYHLSLDSGALGIENCVELIARAFEF